MAGQYNEAQKKATIKYLKENTDDIRLRVPKGTKEKWLTAAKKEGISMTQYVTNIVNEYIERAGQ